MGLLSGTSGGKPKTGGSTPSGSGGLLGRSGPRQVAADDTEQGGILSGTESHHGAWSAPLDFGKGLASFAHTIISPIYDPVRNIFKHEPDEGIIHRITRGEKEAGGEVGNLALGIAGAVPRVVGLVGDVAESATRDFFHVGHINWKGPFGSEEEKRKAREGVMGDLTKTDVLPHQHTSQAISRGLSHLGSVGKKLAPEGFNEQARQQGVVPAFVNSMFDVALVNDVAAGAVTRAAGRQMRLGNAEAASRMLDRAAELKRGAKPLRTVIENVTREHLTPAQEAVFQHTTMTPEAKAAEVERLNAQAEALRQKLPNLKGAEREQAVQQIRTYERNASIQPGSLPSVTEQFAAKGAGRAQAMATKNVIRSANAALNAAGKVALKDPLVESLRRTAMKWVRESGVSRLKVERVLMDELRDRVTLPPELREARDNLEATLRKNGVPVEEWDPAIRRENKLPDDLYDPETGHLRPEVNKTFEDLASHYRRFAADKFREMITSRLGSKGLERVGQTMPTASTRQIKAFQRVYDHIVEARRIVEEDRPKELKALLDEIDKLNRDAGVKGERAARLRAEAADRLAALEAFKTPIPRALRPTRIEATAAKVYEAVMADGGVTLSPHTGNAFNPEITAFARANVEGSARVLAAGEFTPEAVAEWLRAEAKKGTFSGEGDYIGGYTDAQGNVHLDPSTIDMDRDASLIRATADKQIDVWGFGEGGGNIGVYGPADVARSLIESRARQSFAQRVRRAFTQADRINDKHIDVFNALFDQVAQRAVKWNPDKFKTVDDVYRSFSAEFRKRQPTQAELARGGVAGWAKRTLNLSKKDIAGVVEMARRSAEQRHWYTESRAWIDKAYEDAPDVQLLDGRQVSAAEVMRSFVAATSPQRPPKGNFTMAMNALKSLRQGGTIDEILDRTVKRQPDGSEGAVRQMIREIVSGNTIDRWTAEHLANLEGIAPEGELMERARSIKSDEELMRWIEERHHRAKVISFWHNLSGAGDEHFVTVDTWMALAFGDQNVTAANYGEIADAIRGAANRMGWTPHEVQAALWVQTKIDWVAAERRQAVDLAEAGELRDWMLKDLREKIAEKQASYEKRVRAGRKDEVHLVHYSRGKLDVIDPAMRGTGISSLGAEERAAGPASSYYRAGTVPEDPQAMNARAVHHVFVKKSALVDLAEHPDIKIAADRKGIPLADYIRKNTDYEGYYNSASDRPYVSLVKKKKPVLVEERAITNVKKGERPSAHPLPEKLYPKQRPSKDLAGLQKRLDRYNKMSDKQLLAERFRQVKASESGESYADVIRSLIEKGEPMWQRRGGDFLERRREQVATERERAFRETDFAEGRVPALLSELSPDEVEVLHEAMFDTEAGTDVTELHKFRQVEERHGWSADEAEQMADWLQHEADSIRFGDDLSDQLVQTNMRRQKRGAIPFGFRKMQAGDVEGMREVAADYIESGASYEDFLDSPTARHYRALGIFDEGNLPSLWEKAKKEVEDRRAADETKLENQGFNQHTVFFGDDAQLQDERSVGGELGAESGRPDNVIPLRRERDMYQKRQLHPVNEELIQQAKDTFGTTDDFMRAGWILPDGTMLDFKRNDPLGAYKEHGEVAKLWGKDWTDAEAPALRDKFFEETGAVRNNSFRGQNYRVGLEIRGNLTPEQRRVITDFVEHHGGQVVIDAMTRDGRRAESFVSNGTFTGADEASRMLREAQAALPENRSNFQVGRGLGDFEEALGRLHMQKDGRAMMSLWKNADVHTLFHEMGHFVETLVPDHEMEALRKVHLEDAPHADFHEWWADSFLQYLAEGTAPRPALQSLFQRIHALLSAVYATARPVVETARPEVRATLDRWFGDTDEPPAEYARPPKRVVENPEAAYKRGVTVGAEQTAITGLERQARGEEVAAGRLRGQAETLEASANRAGGLRADRQAENLRNRAQATLERVDAALDDPKKLGRLQVAPEWQPTLDFIKAARGQLNQMLKSGTIGLLEYQTLVGQLPKKWSEIITKAADNGFSPAHMRNFSPAQVEALAYSSMRLGRPTVDSLIHEAEAGTRMTRRLSSFREGIDNSFASLIAAKVEVAWEDQTNAVVSYLEDMHVREIPYGMEVPPGFVKWDNLRRTIMEGKDAGTEVAAGTETVQRVIPQSVAKVMESYMKDVPNNFALRALNTINRPWKAAVLTLSPRWYLNNFVGNMVMSAFEIGVPQPFTKGGRETWDAWRKAHRGLLAKDPVTGRRGYFPESPAEIMQIDVVSQTLRDYQLLPDYAGPTLVPHERGLGGVRQVARETTEATGSRAKGAMYGARQAVHQLAQTFQRANTMVDELARSAVFFKTLMKTGDRAFAVERAVKALVDYQTLGVYERSLVRTAIPFYAWQQGILRTAMGLAIDHPARLALAQALGRVNNELLKEEMEKLPQIYEGAIPLPGGGIVLGRGFNPFLDSAQILTPDGLAQSMNPFISAFLRDALHARNFPYGPMEVGPTGYAVPKVSFWDEVGGTILSNLPMIRAAKGITGHNDTLYPPSTAQALSSYFGVTVKTPEDVQRILNRVQKAQNEVRTSERTERKYKARADRRNAPKRSGGGLLSR